MIWLTLWGLLPTPIRLALECVTTVLLVGLFLLWMLDRAGRWAMDAQEPPRG